MNRILLAVLGLAAAFFAGPATIAAPLPPLAALQPGVFRDIKQVLPVNVVFVGYEPGSGAQQVVLSDFLGGLPRANRSKHRVPGAYGLVEFNGVSFEYDYNVVFANSAFEDAFFGWAAANGTAAPRTFYQGLYNEQPAPPRSQTIPATVLDIDAPAAEAWLGQNAPASLGVDTTQYTVFFVNWWGRPDFRFHVYRKTNEPDPDTGFNNGALDMTAMIAFGGTPHTAGAVRRVWFHDLSAGPDFLTINWNLTEADFNGNNLLDYRLPPVWEYGNPSTATFRPFNTLTRDLAKITRYVALNLLFTASPIYRPAISAPSLPTTIRLDVNLYQGESGFDARTVLSEDVLVAELSALQPLQTFSSTVTDVSLACRAGTVFDCFINNLFVAPTSCFGQRLFGDGWGDLFLYHRDHLNQYVDDGVDYTVPIFMYHTTPDRGAGNLLGFADDNWTDGTQSFVFGFSNAEIIRNGSGLTQTLVHEVGHHLGMSHPHDGYDFEDNVSYGGRDAFDFVWVGDQSHSVMGYMFLTNGFGQFDRDNMNRYLTAAYINQANVILAKIAASPRADQVQPQLAQADHDATAALHVYAGMDYLNAARLAKTAYERVRSAAAAIHVQVEPQAWQADYRAKGMSSHFVDELPYDRTRRR